MGEAEEDEAMDPDDYADRSSEAVASENLY